MWNRSSFYDPQILALVNLPGSITVFKPFRHNHIIFVHFRKQIKSPGSIAIETITTDNLMLSLKCVIIGIKYIYLYLTHSNIWYKRNKTGNTKHTIRILKTCNKTGNTKNSIIILN